MLMDFVLISFIKPNVRKALICVVWRKTLSAISQRHIPDKKKRKLKLSKQRDIPEKK